MLSMFMLICIVFTSEFYFKSYVCECARLVNIHPCTYPVIIYEYTSIFLH